MTTERDIINQIVYAREDGQRLARLQMAKDFKSNGVAIEIIAKCTELAVEEVEAL